MEFIGRKEELERLTQAFSLQSQQAVLVYGRRRVGKSELIKEAILRSKQSAIYYECKETTEADNVESLAAVIAEAFNFPRPNFAGIEEVLEYLFVKSKEQHLVVVLDEYPYLRKAVKGMDSILQVLLDKYMRTSNLTLVICGSYVEVMKSLLEKDNPLFGRIDLTINLKPMDYFESALFYPDFSPEDKVRLYSVFGGIPYYNRLINQNLSVQENLMHLIVEAGARLENEVSMYLSSEISKIVNANEIFGALAQGYSRYKDLLAQSHVSSSSAMVDVLEKLIGMELVVKEAPINELDNKRKTAYRICDNMSLFYYRYIFKYSSQRSILNKDIFFERYIAEDFETNYVPHLFEEVCRQYLVRKNRAGELPEPFDSIGRYWYDDPEQKTNGEFDVVTKDPKGYIFYEAKFTSSPVGAGVIAKEIEQVSATGLDCYKYGFFSRSGFEAGVEDVNSVKGLNNLILMPIAELYK